MVFVSQNPIGQADNMEENNLTPEVLIEYLPSGFLDDGENVILFYTSSFDSTSLNLIDTAFRTSACSAIKVILLEDEIRSESSQNLQVMTEKIHLTKVEDKHRAAICIECGFTAFLNPMRKAAVIERYQMDPYVACEYFKMNPITRNDNNDEN